MLIKKNIFILLLCVLSTMAVLAQTDDVDVSYFQSNQNRNIAQQAIEPRQSQSVNNFLSKMSVGGTLGFNFNRYNTNIEISPEIAYHFNDWVCVGVRATYMFSRYNDKSSFEEPINSHVGGAGAFVEGHLFNYVALHVEYRWLNYELYTYNIHNSLEKSRTNSHNILLGGGFYRKIDRFAVYFQIFYNISNKPRNENILDDVVYKAGFAFFLR